jgi:hypothetical protein
MSTNLKVSLAPCQRPARAVIARSQPINQSIRKDEPKVVDTVKASEMTAKVIHRSQ